MNPRSPHQGDFVLPHEDVVLYALIHVANKNNIHPWSLCQGICRRPALMYWISGTTSSMHYSAMRLLVAKLVNQYRVKFDADGFTAPGENYIHCRGGTPPTITANPSAQ